MYHTTHSTCPTRSTCPNIRLVSLLSCAPPISLVLLMPCAPPILLVLLMPCAPPILLDPLLLPTPHKLLVRKFLKRTLDLFNRDIEYSYQVQRIPYADYRVNQLIPLVSSEEFTNSFDESSQSKTREFRLFRKRYGIKIEFYQSGKLGELAWQQKILSLRLNLLDSWLLETGDSVIIKCSYHTHHYK